MRNVTLPFARPRVAAKLRYWLSLSPTGTAYVSCNTFARGVDTATRPGVSYGIYSESYSNVTLANPAPTPGDPTSPLLKNAFEDGGAGIRGFYALYNANTSQPLVYNTFDSYRLSTVAALSNTARVILPIHSPAVDYTNTNSDCHLVNLTTGLQRSSGPTTTSGTFGTKPQLEQCVPNPAQGTTNVPYYVPKGTQKAALLLRRAVDGQLVATLPLNVAAKQCELTLHNYSAGTYFYTLVVDGLPGGTRRLVIE